MSYFSEKLINPGGPEFFFYNYKMAQQFVKLISLDSRNLLPVKYLLIKTWIPPVEESKRLHCGTLT
jgi:hypothetical protein